MINHLIWAAGLLAHLLLLGSLLRRRHAAELPSFTLLIIFYVVRSVALLAARHVLGHPLPLFATLTLDMVDVLLQCAVVAELVWLALKPLPGKRRLTLPVLLAVSATLIVLRLTPHSRLSLPLVLVLGHFWLSVVMVEWAAMLGFLLGPMQRSWRSPAAAISLGFGVYSAALLAGGGYFTTGRVMRDYVFFSYLRIVLYLIIVLFWAFDLWQVKRENA